MLNKTSERILAVLIRKCGNDPTREVKLSEKDFALPKLSLGLIYSVCAELSKDGYISTLSTLYYVSTDIEVALTGKGYFYFDNKKSEKCEFIKRFLLSKISDVIVAAIVAYLTVIISR